MNKRKLAKQYPTEILKKLRLVQIEILGEFERICKKNNLPYFAAYGTALGAVRHQGYIPWDDDLDVGMLREDFEKFLATAEKDLNERYQIMSPRKDKNHAVSVTKIQLKGTKFVSDFSKNLKSEQCIFIDIFPFDKVATDKRKQRKQLSKTTFLGRLLYLCGTPYPIIPIGGIVGGVAKMICFCVHYVLKLFHVSARWLFKKFEAECMKYNNTDSTMVTCFGQPNALNTATEKSELFPIIDVPFENVTIKMPRCYDAMLHREFGDYMKLPPEEQRVNHCPYIIQFENEEAIISE